MSKFKLPSFSYIRAQALKSFLRFPLVILSALFVAITGIILIDYDIKLDKTYYLSLMLTAAYGVPLFFAIHSYLESESNNKIRAGISYLSGFGILLIIFLILPNSESAKQSGTPYIIYLMLSLAIHLVISFAPFLKRNVNNGFWQFNRSLFVRLFIAQLYALVLYGGISGALLAIQELFEFELNDHLFEYLWVIHASLINIWIFVGGIDDDIKELNQLDEYPKALKIFAQYILLPIVGLYFVILYTYIFKVLIQWDWPKGIVSYLVIGVSALTYLTSLLIYPYYKVANHAWIKPLRRALFIAVIPLTLILFVAIGMRINDYGLTINRYIILIVGIWLLCISVYNAIYTGRIKSIPISLSIVAVLISFGPWGAIAVSERNQVNRLKKILVENQILNPNTNKLNWEYSTNNDLVFGEMVDSFTLAEDVEDEIESKLEYLDDFHGFNKIDGWFHQNIDSIIQEEDKLEKYGVNEARLVKNLIVGSIVVEPKPWKSTIFSYKTIPNNIYEISNFDYMFDNLYLNTSSSFQLYNVEDKEVLFKFHKKKQVIEFIVNDTLLAEINLDKLKYDLLNDYPENKRVDQNSMFLKESNDKIELEIYFKEIKLMKSKNSKELEINRMRAKAMIKFK